MEGREVLQKLPDQSCPNFCAGPLRGILRWTFARTLALDFCVNFSTELLASQNTTARWPFTTDLCTTSCGVYVKILVF